MTDAPVDASRAWRRTQTRTIAVYALAGATLLASVLYFGHEIGRHIDGVEAWVAEKGPWALVVFAAAYALLGSVFVPDALLGIVAGSAFGFRSGLAAVAAGTLGAAVLQYVVGRWLLNRRVTRVLGSRPSLAAVLRAVREDELRLQVLIRLTPLNRALTSYALGAIGVGFGRFVMACVALVPSLTLEVYVGYAAKHLARVAGQPERTVELRDGALLLGLALTAAVVALVSRAARRAVESTATGDPSRRVPPGQVTR